MDQQQPQAQTPSAPSKTSKNPFKKVLKYMQGEADKSAKNRWEGGSYLSPPGKEPQQKYRYNRKESRTQSE